MSSIFTISATTPYTSRVMNTATTARMTARSTRPASGLESSTSLRAITMISAERMKSVLIAPAIVAFSCSGVNSACSASPPASWWPLTRSQTFSAPS